MRKFAEVVCILIGLTFSTIASDPVNFVNRIEGTVYSPERLPLENAFVELLNDVDSPRADQNEFGAGVLPSFGMPGVRRRLSGAVTGGLLNEPPLNLHLFTRTPFVHPIAVLMKNDRKKEGCLDCTFQTALKVSDPEVLEQESETEAN